MTGSALSAAALTEDEAHPGIEVVGNPVMGNRDGLGGLVRTEDDIPDRRSEPEVDPGVHEVVDVVVAPEPSADASPRRSMVHVVVVGLAVEVPEHGAGRHGQGDGAVERQEGRRRDAGDDLRGEW